jgi:hypothetical protein
MRSCHYVIQRYVVFSRIIINEKSIQMSVKWIRLYITVKHKIHNNLGHKEHIAHSSHPHSLFVTPPQILAQTPLFFVEPNAH